MSILGRKRADLRIYLGAAPGVGKTYSMLGEAHRRMERGTDVVAAVIETHARRKTAQQLAGTVPLDPFCNLIGGNGGTLTCDPFKQR